MLKIYFTISYETLLIITLSFFVITSVKARIGVGTTTPNSTLQVAGSMSAATVTKTANYTATISDYTILSNNTGGAITIALPAASGTTEK